MGVVILRAYHAHLKGAFMTRRLTAFVLIVLLVPSSGFAGPLTESAAKYIAQTVRPVERVVVDNSGGFIWGGLGLMAGGLTLEVLSVTALEHDDSGCFFGANGSFFCVAVTSRNNAVFVPGLIMAVTGGVLMDVGFMKRRRARSPEIQIGPHAFRIAQHVSF